MGCPCCFAGEVSLVRQQGKTHVHFCRSFAVTRSNSHPKLYMDNVKKKKGKWRCLGCGLPSYPDTLYEIERYLGTKLSPSAEVNAGKAPTEPVLHRPLSAFAGLH